jgi:poly(3-hydroxybutyrate) depolymerase
MEASKVRGTPSGGKNGARYGNINPPTAEISATDLMWDFFATHPKK